MYRVVLDLAEKPMLQAWLISLAEVEELSRTIEEGEVKDIEPTEAPTAPELLSPH